HDVRRARPPALARPHGAAAQARVPLRPRRAGGDDRDRGGRALAAGLRPPARRLRRPRRRGVGRARRARPAAPRARAAPLAAAGARRGVAGDGAPPATRAARRARAVHRAPRERRRGGRGGGVTSGDPLPDWPTGTVAILSTAGGAPHAIPVSTAVRAGPRRVLLALARTRDSLARLRADPRCALIVIAAGDVAF